jgi:hypothetical protein
MVDPYYLLSWAHSFVANSEQGQRNTNLNRAAAYLGKNLGNQEMVFAWVVEKLMTACYKSGLLAEDGHQACLDTIKSGFSAGRRYKEVC